MAENICAKQWCEEQDDEMFSSGWKYDGQNKAGTGGNSNSHSDINFRLVVVRKEEIEIIHGIKAKKDRSSFARMLQETNKQCRAWLE